MSATRPVGTCRQLTLLGFGLEAGLPKPFLRLFDVLGVFLFNDRVDDEVVRAHVGGQRV
jgi:hypothetical protein